MPAWVRPARRAREWRHGPHCASPWPRSTRPSATSPATPRWSRGWTRKAAEAGAHLVRLPRDDADRLPGRGPGLPRVLRGRLEGGARASSPGPGRGRARRPARSSSATSTRTAGPDRAPRRRRGAARATPLAVLHRGRVVATLLQAPPAQLRRRSTRTGTSCRATPCRGPASAGSTSRSTICEDIWQAGGPFAVARAGRRRAGAEHQRLAVRAGQGRRPAAAGARRAAEAGATVAYVNMVGGQDELVFDGDSMVVDADGALLARAAQFAEELLVVDLDLPAATDARARRRRRGEMRVDGTLSRRRLAAPRPAHRPPARRRRLDRRGRGLAGAGRRGCATTCARTASAR